MGYSANLSGVRWFIFPDSIIFYLRVCTRVACNSRGVHHLKRTTLAAHVTTHRKSRHRWGRFTPRDYTRPASKHGRHSRAESQQAHRADPSANPDRHPRAKRQQLFAVGNEQSSKLEWSHGDGGLWQHRQPWQPWQPGKHRKLWQLWKPGTIATPCLARSVDSFLVQ